MQWHNSAHFMPSRFHVTRLFALLFAISVPTEVWAQIVPGTMHVLWNAGAEDCKASPQPPIQVHRYEPQTFILRQNLCVSFEGNFLFLLIGSQKALLIDTGAVADAARMPVAKTVLDLLPVRGDSKIPLDSTRDTGGLS